MHISQKVVLCCLHNNQTARVYAMGTTAPHKLVETQEGNDTVSGFLRRFDAGRILGACRVHIVNDIYPYT